VGVANAAGGVVSFGGSLYVRGAVRPEEFGIVAFAASLLAVSNSVSNWGFSQAAIHRQERADETFATFLVLRLAMLVGILGVLGLVALPFHRFLFQKTDLYVLLALAGAALVDAGCDAPSARLARAMEFRRLAAVDVASVVAATAAGVVMAAMDFGVWALVANRATQPVVRAVGLGFASLETTPLGFHGEDARWLLRFGLPLWVGSVATTWVLNYDRLVVSSLSDKETLGYYDGALWFALVPLSFVTAVLTRVSFSLYARLQADRERLSEAFRIVSGTTLRLAAPMAVGMALVIPDFLEVMGWAQWKPMIPVFYCLLVYAMARPLMDDAGGLLTAVGRPKVTGYTLAAEALALLVLCPALTSRYSARGAAASVGLVVVGGLAVWYTCFLPRVVTLSYRRLLLWPLLSVGAGAGASLGVAAWGGLKAGLACGAVKLATLAAVYVAVMLLLDGRQTAADLRLLREHIAGRRKTDE
jgi:O-antigen/teichoic acid export membrane protein